MKSKLSKFFSYNSSYKPRTNNCRTVRDAHTHYSRNFTLRTNNCRTVKDAHTHYSRNFTPRNNNCRTVRDTQQDTVVPLRRDLQQAVEEKQAAERRLREDHQQLPIMPAQSHETATPPRLVLHQSQEKQHATGNGKLLAIKQPGPPPQTATVQQKAITDMRWQEESKAPQKMCRGSAAVDANMAYFNSHRSTSVHGYECDSREWHRLPDAPTSASP